LVRLFLRAETLFFFVMNEAGQNGESRREFFRDGARYALLTAVATVSATLFQRSGGKVSGQTCINQGICRGCGAFADCGLPQALSAKQAKPGDIS
jgi:hypothetical protein